MTQTTSDQLEEFSTAMRNASPHGAMQNEHGEPGDAWKILGGTAAIIASLLLAGAISRAIKGEPLMASEIRTIR